MAVTTSVRSLRMSTTCAVSHRDAVPLPMPTSAVLNATASLTLR